MTKKQPKVSDHVQRLRPLLRYTAYALAAVVFVMFAVYIFRHSDHTTGKNRLVTFYDRGQQHVILTHAHTVRDALNDAGIIVDKHDDVEPTINGELLSSDSAVIIYRSRPVLVVDGSLRQKVITSAQSPNEIAKAAGLRSIQGKDKTKFTTADFISQGAVTVLTIKRAAGSLPGVVTFKPTKFALSKSKGAQFYTDSDGVVHRETYYDLFMNIVIGSCGGGNYKIRYDGAKVDKDGYVLVAADYAIYPRCSVVETSMGPGKVYDTGGFVSRYPHGFDLATDWSNYDGR